MYTKTIYIIIFSVQIGNGFKYTVNTLKRNGMKDIVSKCKRQRDRQTGKQRQRDRDKEACN